MHVQVVISRSDLITRQKNMFPHDLYVIRTRHENHVCFRISDFVCGCVCVWVFVFYFLFVCFLQPRSGIQCNITLGNRLIDKKRECQGNMKKISRNLRGSYWKLEFLNEYKKKAKQNKWDKALRQTFIVIGQNDFFNDFCKDGITE